MYCSRCGTQNDDASKFCRSCGLDLSHTTPVAAVRDPQVDVTELDLVREQLKDEYEIVDELGRGGMAIVFKAREKQLERDVAIKVLPFSLAFDKEFVERFQREARTSAKLEHPSIIPIYRVGKSGRVIYFVMKFLRGKPLSSVLAARGTLPPAEIRQILVQVARALAYAHKSGIVHRDIKPDNIMFDEHGLAVVTDFGIAKAASGGKLTGTGMSIGTPHYMSPEQARAQALDGRSDIYSLGVVAYQSLTGRVPFDGEDSFSIGYKHIMEEIPTPPLETYDQRTVFEITRKMMAKSPDERFQSAEDRKSTRLNSSHSQISYAVFCLKKKKKRTYSLLSFAFFFFNDPATTEISTLPLHDALPILPFDGEASFSIGYKHIMEEIPPPPLETYDQRTVFEITRKMMAKSPDERFQSADDLVQSLEAGGGLPPGGLPPGPPKTTPPPPGGGGAPAPPPPPPPAPARPRARRPPHDRA